MNHLLPKCETDTQPYNVISQPYTVEITHSRSHISIVLAPFIKNSVKDNRYFKQTATYDRHPVHVCGASCNEFKQV